MYKLPWEGFASALLQHGAALPMTTLHVRCDVPNPRLEGQYKDKAAYVARVQILSDALQSARHLRKLVLEDGFFFGSARQFPHLTQITCLSFWMVKPFWRSSSLCPADLSQLSALSGLQEVVVRGVHGDEQSAVREVIHKALPQLRSLTLITPRPARVVQR
jgi:hypothetical protein